LWWFADCIQYDNQRKLQKRAPPILSGKIHALADSFISKNEGMNESSPGETHLLWGPGDLADIESGTRENEVITPWSQTPNLIQLVQGSPTTV
jgi:hypothetical protein